MISFICVLQNCANECIYNQQNVNCKQIYLFFVLKYTYINISLLPLNR